MSNILNLILIIKQMRHFGRAKTKSRRCRSHRHRDALKHRNLRVVVLRSSVTSLSFTYF